MFPGEAWIAAALVAVVQRFALSVLRARIGRTLVDRCTVTEHHLSQLDIHGSSTYETVYTGVHEVKVLVVSQFIRLSKKICLAL